MTCQSPVNADTPAFPSTGLLIKHCLPTANIIRAALIKSRVAVKASSTLSSPYQCESVVVIDGSPTSLTFRDR